MRRLRSVEHVGRGDATDVLDHTIALAIAIITLGWRVPKTWWRGRLNLASSIVILELGLAFVLKPERLR